MSRGTWAGTLLRIGVPVVLAGVAVLFLAGLVEAWPHTADDAYITLRYARHLAEGAGVTWNPAGDPGVPPVEGYSNFLFVLLGAALIRLGAADPMPWLEALGAIAALGTLAVAGVLALRRHGAVAALIVSIAIAAHPGQAFWAVSGMETTVCQLLVMLAVYWTLSADTEPRLEGAVSDRVRGDRRRLAAGLALFAASLARPESPIVLAPLTAFLLTSPSSVGVAARARGAARLVLPFLLLYLPYTAWRLWHFGRWLPNSAACKAGFESDPLYLGREFLGYAWPFLALGLLGATLGAGLGRGRVRRREYLLLLGIPLLYFATFYGVDPIMSHLDRHFLVALPLVVLAGTFGLFAGLEALARATGRDISGTALSTASLLVAGAVLLGVVTAPKTFTAIQRAVTLAHPLEDVRRELGIFLRANVRPEETYAIGDTGLVPFLAEATVLDVYCLNCREATAPPIDRSPERLASWILSKRPRYIVIQAVGGGAERGVWPADRALKKHPMLETEYARVREFGDDADPLRYLVFERRARAPAGASL